MPTSGDGSAPLEPCGLSMREGWFPKKKGGDAFYQKDGGVALGQSKQTDYTTNSVPPSDMAAICIVVEG